MDIWTQEISRNYGQVSSDVLVDATFVQQFTTSVRDPFLHVIWRIIFGFFPDPSHMLCRFQEKWYVILKNWYENSHQKKLHGKLDRRLNRHESLVITRIVDHHRIIRLGNRRLKRIASSKQDNSSHSNPANDATRDTTKHLLTEYLQSTGLRSQ